MCGAFGLEKDPRFSASHETITGGELGEAIGGSSERSRMGAG